MVDFQFCTVSLIGLGYLVGHFVLYVFFLRQTVLFQSERGIFLYHLTSAILFSGTASAFWIVHFNDAGFATALALVAAHGIYSISFLELWSLAQGSYSIAIIAGAASQGAASREDLVEVYSVTGSAKKEERLSALEKSRLIRQADESSWELTACGRRFAKLLTGLRWMAKIETAG